MMELESLYDMSERQVSTAAHCGCNRLRPDRRRAAEENGAWIFLTRGYF
jgi:hypothetical protein